MEEEEEEELMLQERKKEKKSATLSVKCHPHALWLASHITISKLFSFGFKSAHFHSDIAPVNLDWSRHSQHDSG